MRPNPALVRTVRRRRPAAQLARLGRPLDYDCRGMGCSHISWVVHDATHGMAKAREIEGMLSNPAVNTAPVGRSDLPQAAGRLPLRYASAYSINLDIPLMV